MCVCVLLLLLLLLLEPTMGRAQAVRELTILRNDSNLPARAAGLV